MMVSVYTVTHRASGSQYVGISKNPYVRWKSHRWHARHGSEGHFHRALAKYGPDAFDWKVFAQLPSLAEAQIAERILIAVQRPEYNMSAGGDGNWGYVPSAAARAKVGAAHRGMKRPPRSAEHAEKIAATRRGRSLSAEHKAKISAGLRKRFPKKPEKTERTPRTAEHCAKLSAALKGRKRSPEQCARIRAAKLGTIHSAETRAKMSAAHLARRTKDSSK